MRSPSLLLILIISTLTAGCSGKADVPERDYPVINNPEWGVYQDYEIPPFRFELMDSILIETPNDEVVGSIRSLITDNDGNVYFLDPQQSKLVSISSDGNFRWMTGQKGKGPGDFEHAYSMISNSKSILVGNMAGRRLDKYGFSGNFISSIPIGKEFATLHEYTEDNLLAITNSLQRLYGHKAKFFSIASDSLILEKELIIDQSKGTEAPLGFSANAGVKFHGSQVISGSLLDYSLTFYNPDSTISKVITRDFNKNMKPGFYDGGDTQMMTMMGGVESPFIMPDGIMIVPVIWPDNIPDSDEYMKKQVNRTAPKIIFKNSLDFFDTDGVLLFSLESDGLDPEIGAIQHIDKNGIIYTASVEPKPVIYRYKLIGPEQL